MQSVQAFSRPDADFNKAIHDSLRGKRTHYYSDNRRQTPLDLLIDSLLSPYMQSPQNQAISIYIIKDKIPFIYNYGESSPGFDSGASTIYEAGGFTHTFLGLLFSRAVEEKKLQLNDDARKYLPDAASGLHYNSRPVRVSELATHSSGLDRLPFNLYAQQPFDSLDPFRNYDTILLNDFLNKVRPSELPGQSIKFSVMNSVLLGMVLETVYQKPLKELFQLICSEYGLRHTYFNEWPADTNLMAIGRDLEGKIVPGWTYGAIPAGGALHSTAGDIGKMSGLLLDQYQKTKQLAVYKVGQQMVSTSFFVKLDQAGEKMFWQNIGTGGFSVFWTLIPEKKNAVILMSSSAMNIDYLGLAILRFLQN